MQSLNAETLSNIETTNVTLDTNGWLDYKDNVRGTPANNSFIKDESSINWIKGTIDRMNAPT